jgi:cytochrome P450
MSELGLQGKSDSSLDEVFAEISATWGAFDTDDPFPMLAERRTQTPVMEGDIMVALGLAPFGASGDTRPAYSLFKYDDIVKALRDPGTFSASIWWESFDSLTGRIVMGMDGAEHLLWRRMMMPVFTNRVLDVWRETVVRPVAARSVEELRPAGATDLIHFAQRYPVRMIYEIFGFIDTDRYDDFAVNAITVLLGLTGNPETHARAVEACDRLYAWLLPVVERRRAEGASGDDLISRLINTEVDGQQLDDRQITEFVRSLLPPSTETTARMFANAMCLILERPSVLETLRQQPELIPDALIEAERFDSPISVIPRITTREVEIRGVTIPAGAVISLVLGSANRDEDAFTDPEVYDINRKESRPLAFGFGPHICPGMATARTEIVDAIAALLAGLPGLRLDPDRPQPRIVGAHMRGPSTLPVVWDR